MDEASKAIAEQYLAGISAPQPVAAPAVTDALVPDILNTPPSKITEGQPAWEEPTDLMGKLRRMENTGEADLIRKQAMVQGPFLSGVTQLAAPLAADVAQNPAFQPGARGMAADLVAKNNENQAAMQAQLDAQGQVDPAADAALQAKLQAAGLPSSQPPAVAQPTPAPEVDVTAKDLEPSKEQVIEARAKIVKPAQEAIAEKTAMEQADLELANAANAARQREEQIKSDIFKLDSDIAKEVRQNSLASMLTQGPVLNRVMSALAITMGGAGAAVLGESNNAVIDQIDKGVEQQAQRDKLNNDQKLALRREALDAVKSQIDILQTRTQNAQAKANLDIQKQKLQVERDELNLKLQEAHRAKVLGAAVAGLRAGGTGIKAATPQIAKQNAQIDEVMAALDMTDPKRAEALREVQVTTPDGRKQFANVNKERVAEFEKYASETKPAVDLLRDIKKFAATANKLSMEDRSRMGTMLAVAAGKLRLPITGPGAMTEDEYQRLRDTIGDPMKIISYPPAELAKIDSTIGILNADLTSRAGQIGVSWPATKAEKVAAALQNRGYSPAEIRAALSKMPQGN